MDVVADRLTRRYPRHRGGEVVALDDVTATFRGGQVSAIVGRSGSGKSTLIRVLSALEKPDSGEVAIGDEMIVGLGSRDRMTVRKNLVSMVFQDHGLIAEMSVRENLLLALHISKSQTGRQGISNALDEVDLAGFEKRLIHTLSGGEQQRVAIARALALGHPVLLADEPTGSLDADNARAVAHALERAARSGCAVVVATHDPIVSDQADVIWRISDGRLAAA